MGADMTITIKAVDAATQVLQGITGGVRRFGAGMLSVFTAVGRGAASLLSRLFSLRTFITGALIGVLTRLATSITQSLAVGPSTFTVFFSDENQRRINSVATAINRLGATLRATFGNIIAANADSITRFLNNISYWITQNQDKILDFIFEVKQAATELWNVLKGIGETAGGIASGAAMWMDDVLRSISGWRKEFGNVAGDSLPEFDQFGGALQGLTQDFKITADAIDPLIERLKTIEPALQSLNPLLTQTAGILTDDIVNALDAAVSGTIRLSQAFGQMIASIIRDLGRLLLQDQLFKLFTSLLSGLQASPVAEQYDLFGPVGVSGIAGTTRLAGAGAGSGARMTINQTFVGPQNPEEVKRQTRAAVLEGLQGSDATFRQSVQRAVRGGPR